MKKTVISVMGKDTVGITAKVSAACAEYNVNIIAYKANDKIVPFNANYIFNENEHLLVLGSNEDLKKLTK